MGQIKSALELALEKTDGIKGDKSKLIETEYRERGMRMLAQATEDPEFSIEKALKAIDKQYVSHVRAGLLAVVLTNLTLPNDESSLTALPTLKRVLHGLVRHTKKIDAVFDQLEQFLARFLSDRTQMIEEIRKQLEGHVRRKEDELSRKMGYRVKVDPATDPEFSKHLVQNLEHLRAHYAQILDQVKDQIREVAESER